MLTLFASSVSFKHERAPLHPRHSIKPPVHNSNSLRSKCSRANEELCVARVKILIARRLRREQKRKRSREGVGVGQRSEAPFVGERVFQNRGVCLQAFPRCPTPSPLLSLFCSRPNFRATRIFARTRHIALRSYGNACYAGYNSNFLISLPSLFSTPASIQ